MSYNSKPPTLSIDQTALTPELMEQLRQHCLDDLYFFAKGILGFNLLEESIHLPICLELENLENTRYCVVLPRGWFKSTLILAYAMWRAVKDSNIRICIVQNTHTNAMKKLSVIRGKFESCGMLRTLFPELIPDKSCTWTGEALELPRAVRNAEATFEAAGTRTKMTSRHYDIIIEDDTVAPDLDDLTAGVVLPSKEDVQQAIGWHQLATPLLVDPGKGQILIVGTRWFELDLISWNQENEPSYKRLTRAVRETDGYPDEGGLCVWPGRFSDTVLADIEKAMGPYMYSCLYMNKPIRAEGMPFHAEWFEYYETPPRDLFIYTTVDFASDPEECKGDPDFNVVMTIGKDMRKGKDGLYVLDYFHARCNPSELLDAVFDHARRFKPLKVCMESVQYQKSALYYTKERMRASGTYFMVEGITHGRRSKNARILGLQPLVKSRALKFRREQRKLVSEFLAFPYGAHDDLIDAVSMQIPIWAITKLEELMEGGKPEDDPFSVDSALVELEELGKIRGAADYHSAYSDIERPQYN